MLQLLNTSGDNITKIIDVRCILAYVVGVYRGLALKFAV